MKEILFIALVVAFLIETPSVLSAAPLSATPPLKISPSTPSTGVTPEEYQELDVARQAALKAHPNLVAKSQALAAKMRAFRVKLNEAMAKIDPKLGPFLGKEYPGHSLSALSASQGRGIQHEASPGKAGP